MTTIREIQDRETQAAAQGELVEAALCQVVLTGAVAADTYEALSKADGMLLASICLRAGRWDTALARQALEA